MWQVQGSDLAKVTNLVIPAALEPAVGQLWLMTSGDPEMQQKISGHKHR